MRDLKVAKECCEQVDGGCVVEADCAPQAEEGCG